VGLTRDPEKAKPKNPTIHWYAWQGSSERPPAEALSEVDGVVNLIGEEINQRLTSSAKDRIRESRVTATRNLVQAIEAAGLRLKVFVGQSAIGSISTVDFPAIMSVSVIISLFFALSNLLVAILYFYLDPRLRVGS